MKQAAHHKVLSIIWAVICAVAAMVTAVYVRLPAASLEGTPEEIRHIYQEENGLPYLSDVDSYYHVILADNYIKTGSFGDSVKDGTPWDSLSSYPEGRSASYQPGIVWLTAGLWKILKGFGFDLYTVEFWLSVIMAAVTALAGFILGRRMSGSAGGFVTGVLVSCTSGFLTRTVPGRYDTDMFVVLMDIMLLLFLTEILRATTVKGRIAAWVGFGLSFAAYTLCWSSFSFLLGGLVLSGGILYLVVLFFSPKTTREGNGRFRWIVRQPETIILCGSAALGFIFMLLIKGVSFLPELVRMVKRLFFVLKSNKLPDSDSMIAELDVPAWFPRKISNVFKGYIPDEEISVLTGVGSLSAALLCIAALIILGVYAVKTNRKWNLVRFRRRTCAAYLCVFGTFLVGCLFMVSYGNRFVEHLGVAVGILAGAGVGWLIPDFGGNSDQKFKAILTGTLLTTAAVVPCITGGREASAFNMPSVTDASDFAMNWIKENAEDPEAVVLSWWDKGYYYEYASGHPTFWDGGSLTYGQAVLMAKALTADDMHLSRDIFQMLAWSGSKAFDVMKEHIKKKDAFEAIWETLSLDKEETVRVLTDQYGLSQEIAVETEALIHPPSPRECYVIITDTMLMQLGWFEYYRDWDYTGESPEPVYTVYDIKPDGTANLDMEDEKSKAYFAERAKETIWRLSFDGDGEDCFIQKVYIDDKVHEVQIWKCN